MPGIRRLAALAILFALAAPRTLFAGGGPQNVVVIANPNDPDSLAIANYYVELRDIPPANVVYIPWRINIHAATAVQFRDQLLKPLLETLQERNIDDHVTTLAFSSGYPYLIDCAPLFSGQQFPRQSRPVTSL